jgi:hypothetical protein
LGAPSPKDKRVTPSGRPAPRIELVVELEELTAAHIISFSDGDELRLLRDLESRRDLSEEVLDALDEALTVLQKRAGTT